jgi:hypothetical protein
MKSNHGNQVTAGSNGYHCVRAVPAIVLLAAAGLKFQQLASEPVGEIGIFHARWFMAAIAECELFVGIWLLSNAWPKPTRAVAIACFGLFAAASLFEASVGEHSCRCFGELSINPWCTAIFDLVAVAAFLRWRPMAASFDGKRAAVALAVWLFLGVPAAYAVASYEEATLSDAGEIIGDGNVVVLKPETWIGKRFPLLGHVDFGDQLANGIWLVLLHRHDCSACREAAAEYESIAKEFATKHDRPSIALIECPPFARMEAAAASGPWVVGRVDNAEQWSIPGPISVLLDGGRVQNVFKNALDTELVKEIWR